MKKAATKGPRLSPNIKKMMDNLYGSSPEAHAHFKALLDALPDESFVQTSMENANIELSLGYFGEPFEVPTTPEFGTFILWVAALKMLREHQGIRQYMRQLGAFQPILPDLGMVQPTLPSRVSIYEDDVRLYEAFPDMKLHLDFVKAVPPEHMLGLHVVENEDNKDDEDCFHLEDDRVALLAQERFDWYFIKDNQETMPFVLVDMGGYFI